MKAMTTPPERRCVECAGDSLHDDNDDCEFCDDYAKQFGQWFPISAETRAVILDSYGIDNLTVSRSLSNYIEGIGTIDPRFAPLRLTVWADQLEADFLRDETDADGHRQWIAHYS